MSTPTQPFRRSDDYFTSGGVRCAAWVYRPTARTTVTPPVIVMAHGLGSVRALRLPAFAERFVVAGYVVVVFDYRSFGDSDGHPRRVVDVAAQLADWRAALAWARTLDGVDPSRIIAWGTSFAGGHVITLAGTGENLTAIIAQVPHVSGPAAVRATGLHALRLVPAALDDTLRAALHRSPRYVNPVGTPGTVAAMATPDAEAAVDRLFEASGIRRGELTETIAARILARIGLYSPIRHAPKVPCPALVQVATGDSIAPAAPARKAARRMRQAILQDYDGGHFDPYVDPLFESVVTAQLDFLARNVPVNTGNITSSAAQALRPEAAFPHTSFRIESRGPLLTDT
ncbi:alpha/beta fold hydrolase [Mycolicibacterium neoaurum]|uniref:alpha/beta hydrolase n=1 Tax=Mycolicibacterium neoaurum TaxID=1795 RepID=UPI002673293D|nr:alpha/beta fold hydrolase [Mycolicibacterium neoaurum]MDO3401711.1 alpha/beta fold hydrolase [Mycolicibacterium neoaurum]